MSLPGPNLEHAPSSGFVHFPESDLGIALTVAAHARLEADEVCAVTAHV